ncbi:hypothetical protein MIR68_011021 [Amoeboaphelidium protococcarum]|nr:hypothetical protein MIR68_011021 [Amoeboaphelidium protococcarum]
MSDDNKEQLVDDVWNSETTNVEPFQQDDLYPDRVRDLQKHSSELYKIGFRDGVDEGEKETLQQGFNDGFSVGREIGMLLGELKATLEYLSYTLVDITDLRHRLQSLLNDRVKSFDVIQQMAAQNAQIESVDHVQLLSGEKTTTIIQALKRDLTSLLCDAKNRL